MRCGCWKKEKQIEMTYAWLCAVYDTMMRSLFLSDTPGCYRIESSRASNQHQHSPVVFLELSLFTYFETVRGLSL